MKPRFDGKTVVSEVKELPETPGVYFFLDERGGILYIGKATVLRDRARSYFSQDILETRGPKIRRMLSLAVAIAWRVTDSVLEALILEQKLIKEQQPPYNTDAKDDKSYNHIVITDEPFPRVLIVRGRDLAEGKFAAPVRAAYGPFPHGTQLKEAMKIVRRLFPFRDTCEPAVGEMRGAGHEMRKTDRACFHRQIGLCPGVCTGEVSVREYARTIRNIRLLFEGKKDVILRMLEKEMSRSAKDLRFEKAGEIKRTLFALRHIQDVALLTDNRERTIDNGKSIRIEAYDVAHLFGEASVGVMTVVEGGRLNKDEYRVFNLRGNHHGDDLAALEEVLSRRLRHSEWKTPDIVALDGSFLQLGVAKRLLADHEAFQPLLIGVVKDAHHKPKDILHLPAELAHLRADILLANGEAHRFAIRHHRAKRSKEFLGE